MIRKRKFTCNAELKVGDQLIKPESQLILNLMPAGYLVYTLPDYLNNNSLKLHSVNKVE